MEVIPINKKFEKFLKKEGDLLEGNTLDDLFPTIKDDVKDMIKKDKDIKKEMETWLKNEMSGMQFNAVRYCKIPEEESGEFYSQHDNGICESYRVCPFYRQGIAPVGDFCPLEMLVVKRTTEDLIKELEINIYEDVTDAILVGEIVTFTLLEQRAVRGLACTSLGFSTYCDTKFGRDYMREKSYYLDVIKEMQLTKDRLRKSLVATREEKLKLKKNKSLVESEDKYKELLSKIKKERNLGVVIDVEVEE
jgi:nucleoside diphosphate kinase